MRRRRRRSNSEINFWQSNTDMMSGLILVLILIIALLALYLLQIPDHHEEYADAGDNYNVDDAYGNHYDDDDDYDHEEDHDDDSGGGDDDEFDQEYPLPSSGGNDWNKAAVYATVVDEETGRAILKEGITFELYEVQQEEGENGAIRFLNTYYPVKTEYRNYETTERGVFYLPEKIDQGHYYFKPITELEGYDTPENVTFTIDRDYDWPDPFVISIPVSPARNTFQIVLEDANTGARISGGTFIVKAAEDIVTADDTVRYKQQETVQTIELDEEGTGTSTELFLGTYDVSQGQIPKYYAMMTESQHVVVQQKGITDTDVLHFTAQKTEISIRLVDDFDTSKVIEGAEFELQCEEHPEFNQTAATDANGNLSFTNLEKNTVYHLKQLNAPDQYLFEQESGIWKIDEYGMIDGKAKVQETLTNYIVRTKVEIKDRILGTPVSNQSVSLYHNEELLKTWTSSGEGMVFENLPAGNYEVEVNQKRYAFAVVDGQALTVFTVHLLTTQSIIISAIGVIAIVCVIGFVVHFLRHRKKKTEGEDN